MLGTYFDFHTQLSKPIVKSCEHDPLSISQSHQLKTMPLWPEFPPAATGAVDAGLSLFSELLPLQDSTLVTRTITQLIEATRSPKFDKNIGRKAAALINASMAILLALRQAMGSSSRQVRDIFGLAQVTAPISAFLKACLAIFRSATSVNTQIYLARTP